MYEILLHLFPKNNKGFGLLDIYILDSEIMAGNYKPIGGDKIGRQAEVTVCRNVPKTAMR